MQPGGSDLDTARRCAAVMMRRASPPVGYHVERVGQSLTRVPALLLQHIAEHLSIAVQHPKTWPQIVSSETIVLSRRWPAEPSDDVRGIYDPQQRSVRIDSLAPFDEARIMLLHAMDCEVRRITQENARGIIVHGDAASAPADSLVLILLALPPTLLEVLRILGVRVRVAVKAPSPTQAAVGIYLPLERELVIDAHASAMTVAALLNRAIACELRRALRGSPGYDALVALIGGDAQSHREIAGLLEGVAERFGAPRRDMAVISLGPASPDVPRASARCERPARTLPLEFLRGTDRAAAPTPGRGRVIR